MPRSILIISFIFICLVTFSSCATTRPAIGIPKQPPPTPKMKIKPEVALVLGGGGARGYAHIGVIKVLQQAGVPINLIVGASAGSLIGAIYADSANAKQLQNIMLNTDLSSFVDVSSANLKGLISGSQLETFLMRHMHAKTFKQLKIKFIAVATNLKTGAPVMLDSGPIAPAITASTAIPGLLQPVHLYGKTLVDGGMTDPVPVDVAKKFHPKVIIAVNIGEALPAKMPETSVGVYDRAYDISWQKLEKLSEHGANIIIHPPVGDTNMFNVWDKKAMILAGEEAAKKALPQILKLLKKDGITAKTKSLT